MKGLLLVLVVLLGAAQFACSASAVAVPPGPIWAAIGYDISKSVGDSELPSLTPEQLDELLRIVEQRGGAVGFSTIGASPHITLRRLELTSVDGLLNERAAKASANRRRAQVWREYVVTALQQRRGQGRTSFGCWMQSASDFFGESIVPANAEKVAIVWSDGRNTTRACPALTFAKDVRILVSGMHADVAAQLGGLRVERFENTEGLLKALAQ